MNAPPRHPGFGRDVLDLLFAPSRLFESLRERPRTLVPLLVLSLGMGAFALSVATGPMLNDIREQFESSGMPPEHRALILAKMSGGLGRITAVIPAVAAPILAVVVAAVLGITLVVLRALRPGPQVPFRTLVSLTAHVGLLDLFEFLLKLPLMFAKGTLHVYSSPALLLPEEAADSRLFAFLNSFDLFSLWKLGLFALGLSIVAGRKKGEAAFAVALLWIVFVLIKTALHGVLTPHGGLA